MARGDGMVLRSRLEGRAWKRQSCAPRWRAVERSGALGEPARRRGQAGGSKIGTILASPGKALEPRVGERSVGAVERPGSQTGERNSIVSI